MFYHIWCSLLLFLVTKTSAQQCGLPVPGHSDFQNINDFLRGAEINIKNSGDDGWVYWSEDSRGHQPGDPVVSEEVKNLVFKVRVWILFVPVTRTYKLSRLIEDGRFRVKNLKCDNLYILNNAIIRLTGDTFVFQGMDLNCDGDVEWDYLVWDDFMIGALMGSSGSIGIRAKGRGQVSKTFAITSKYEIAKSLRGVAPLDGDLPRVAVPTSIRFHSCRVVLASDTFYLKPNSFGQWLISTIINIARYAFEEAVCNMFTQLGDHTDQDPGGTGGMKSGLISRMLTSIADSLERTARREKPYATPLAAEDAMLTPIPSGVEDFTDSFRYDVLNVLLNDWLGSAAEGQGDRLVINTLIDRLTENTQGYMSFSTNKVYGDSSARLMNQVYQIKGLNTFRDLNIARNADGEQEYKHTLFHGFTLSDITMRANQAIVLSPQMDRTPGCPDRNLVFDSAVDVVVSNPHFNVATLFAIVVERLDYVHLGNVLDFDFDSQNAFDRSLACVGKSLHDASFTDFQLSWPRIPQFELTGFVDKGVTKVIRQINAMFQNYYGGVFSAWAEELVQGQIQNINDAMREAFENAISDDGRGFECPEFYEPNKTKTAMVNFTSPAVLNVKEGMQKTIEIVDDPSIGINRVVGIMTEKLQEPWNVVNQDGELVKKTIPGTINFGQLFDSGVPIDGKYAKLRAHDFQISNLNQLTHFSILNPRSSREFRNEIDADSTEHPLTLQIRFSYDSDAAFDFDASEQWTFTIEYFGIKLAFDTAMDADMREFFPLTFKQLNNPACYFHSIKNLQLPSFNATHNVTKVGLQCNGCSLRNKLMKPVAVEKMTAITNAAFAIMRESINNQDAVAAARRLVDRYSEKCVRVTNISSLFEIPTVAPTEPLETPGELVIALANVFIYFVIAVFLGLLYYRYRIHAAEIAGARKALGGLAGSQDRHAPRSAMLPEMMAIGETGKGVLDINRIGPSMFFDPNVPVISKFLVPLLGIGILAMFLSANMLNGGAVNAVVITESDIEIELDSLFDFTLVGSIDNMFQANVAGLGIIIALASGSWPYAKVVLTLVAFFVPPRVLPVSTRTKLLHFLDVAGKWSVVDQILMGLLLVVFNIQVQVPAPDNPDWYLSDLIPDNFLTVIVRIVPQWGLYGFLLAALLSIFHGHMVVHYHNKIKDKAWQTSPDLEKSDLTKRNAKIFSQRLPLRAHNFERHLDKAQERKLVSYHASTMAPGAMNNSQVKGYKIRYSDCAGFTVLFLFNVAFITLIAAVLLETFRFELGGVGGLAMTWLSPGSADLPLSILGATTGIPNQSRDSNETLGLIFILLSLVTISFVVPLIQLILNFVLWFVPLSFRDQKRLFRIVEGLQAWSALDVFMGAILAAYLNLEIFAAFMTKPYCAEIDVVLQDMGVSSGLLTEDQATCFRVTPFISDGFVVLIVAVLLTSGLNHLVVSSCRTSLVDRETYLKGCHNPYHVDPESGVPTRQLKSFFCKLSDMTLISIGIVKPIILLGKVDPEHSAFGSGSGAPSASRNTQYTQGSYPWSVRDQQRQTQGASEEQAIRTYHAERVDRLHENGNFQVENKSFSMMAPWQKLKEIGSFRANSTLRMSSRDTRGFDDSSSSFVYQGQYNDRQETGNPRFGSP